ncbi:SDR family NAD(P)-dependent oxidoreductase [Sulfitobacter sp.]|uniref:SDR family NAD(P)-dependent oxidoreductase n=1 Tax=Sulfitobacter sp. TaxID=1903071 RepID=UPI00329978B6
MNKTTQPYQGRSVLITGAAGRLGRDLARALAAAGAARLYLVDRDEVALETLARELGPTAMMLPCDLSDAVAMREAWGGLDLAEGLDALFTAAGTLGSGAGLAEVTPEDWDALFAINVRGTLLTIQLSLPALRARRGAIVTYGSTAGLAGSRALGPYSASKGAVSMLTRSFALSLAADGIRVNSVCPGSIDSEMFDRTVEIAGGEGGRAAYLSMYPLGRFGEAAEVTAAALFLGSPSASYITGVELPVDGGRLA